MFLVVNMRELRKSFTLLIPKRSDAKELKVDETIHLVRGIYLLEIQFHYKCFLLRSNVFPTLLSEDF